MPVVGEAKSRRILRVKLDEVDLSLGELGRLLQTLQTGIRATATVLGASPEPRSLRASGLTQGTLEFFVEALGWGPELVRATSVFVVGAVNSLISDPRTALVGSLIPYFLQQRQQQERDRRQEERDRQREVFEAHILERIDELERTARQPWRIHEARDLADRLNMPVEWTLAGLSADDALRKVVDMVGRSGGGVIESVATRRRARVPSQFSLPRRRR